MYIKDLSCISPQHTFDETFFMGSFVPHSDNHYLAIEPTYDQVIPSGMMRRMGKAVRMGTGLGLPLLRKHDGIGAIILGTSDGGIEDSMKFLDQIVKYKEGALTPTNFVQSTPNSLAGQLALMGKITGYNATHVNNGLAFESALADALLLLAEDKVTSLLVGNVEQFAVENYNIESLAGTYKEVFIGSDGLIGSSTPGTVCGEGVAMFVVVASPDGALATISGVDQCSYLAPDELEGRIRKFLFEHKLNADDIDGLVLGLNGDNRTDHWYTRLTESVFQQQAVYTYKNLVGEYPTASAFALWLSVHILQGKKIPSEAILRKGGSKNKRLLVYNQYKSVQHGFMLVNV
jgi:3-oxoacyl-(acyl-carrier-protein) synthase